MEALSAGIQARVAEQYVRAQRMLAEVDVDASPEALHQYRVSLRKARSLLTLYRLSLEHTPAALVAEMLAEQATIANRARDLDVFLTTLPEGKLRDRVGEMRREAYDDFANEAKQQARDRAVVQWLLSSNWAEAENCCGLDEETDKVRASLLAKIGRQCLRLQSRPSSRQWHRLRILVKRWRYLESLCGANGEISHLKAGQTLLGDFNDLCCQITLLKRIEQGDDACRKEAKRTRKALKLAKSEKKGELDHWIKALVVKKGADDSMDEKSR